ncbi:MAG: UbiA family prenyltransferase [Candidatus Heimdallarchaeota archaeon]|nr:UbiA family prenyltransferase [Candidatus Heimdallarchaeota archaeon]MCK4877545.1 UbiA family prenyltransferase [Candidatus Heimdallarchaeota archaeon]
MELCLFATIGLFVSGILAEDLTGFQWEYLIAFLIIFFAVAGSFAINDYFDFEIDRENQRKDRPIVLGLISRRTALYIAILFSVIVIILSIFLNPTAMIFALINFPIFYLYSLGLKKFILFKNLLIAYSYSATILFGSLISDSFLEPIIIYFTIMGFIIGLGSEIMFDIADIEGDKLLNVNTIPNKYGTQKAAKISIFAYFIIIVLDPLPFYVFIDSRFYFDYIFLALICIPIVGYIYLSISLFKNQTKENTLKLRMFIFLIMQIGTIAYLIGALI